MAKVTIGGVEYETAPRNLETMFRAAPYIDSIQAMRRADDTSLSGMMASVREMLSVFAIAIPRDEVTVDAHSRRRPDRERHDRPGGAQAGGLRRATKIDVEARGGTLATAFAA